jgi:hypothetical protein
MIFKRGDFVRVNYQGRTVEAMVTLASPNGQSLIIMWGDGMLGGHVGVMPILGTPNGDDTILYTSLLEGEPIMLERIVPS